MNQNKKISGIFGTRPEGVKLAPRIMKLKSSSGLDVNVCITGQHRQMLNQVLATFDIKPDRELSVMAPGQTPAGLTGKLMTGISGCLRFEHPDMAIVQGDTTQRTVKCITAYFSREN